MQRSSGFTLIELMITVAIVSILVAVGLPSYQAHMIKAVRSQGQQFLLDLAQREEQYFLDARWYASGIAASSTAGMMTIWPAAQTSAWLPIVSSASPSMTSTVAS